MTETTPSSTVSNGASDPVTLVIIYPEAQNAVVKLDVTRDIAAQMIDHRTHARASIARFHHTDLHGNPFSVDVGTAAAAVYCEHE